MTMKGWPSQADGGGMRWKTFWHFWLPYCWGRVQYYYDPDSRDPRWWVHWIMPVTVLIFGVLLIVWIASVVSQSANADYFYWP